MLTLTQFHRVSRHATLALAFEAFRGVAELIALWRARIAHRRLR